MVKSIKSRSRKYLLLAPCSLVGVMYIDDDLIRIWAENDRVLKNNFAKLVPLDKEDKALLNDRVVGVVLWPCLLCALVAVHQLKNKSLRKNSTTKNKTSRIRV